MLRSGGAGALVGTLTFMAFFDTPLATLLGLVVGVLSGLVAAEVGAWLRQRLASPVPEIIALGLAVLALSPLWLGFCVLAYQIGIRSPADQRQVREDGNRIVEALHEYKRYKGHYPSSLTGLVPEYLDYLPTQPNGEPFRYKAGEEGFSLVFGVGWLRCHYDNHLEVVTCID
jgi:hypothetical protein